MQRVEQLSTLIGNESVSYGMVLRKEEKVEELVVEANAKWFERVGGKRDKYNVASERICRAAHLNLQPM